MLPNSYFENILKRKTYFNDAEIALMTPTQSRAYRITGHIKRGQSIAKETKYLNKMIKHIQRKKRYINQELIKIS